MWLHRIVTRAPIPGNAAGSPLLRVAWYVHRAANVVALVAVAVLLLAGVRLPAVATALPAALLIAYEAEVVFIERLGPGVRPRSLRRRFANWLLLIVALSIATDAWWVTTTVLGLMLVICAGLLPARGLALATLAAATLNVAVPAITAAIPWLPTPSADRLKVWVISATVYPAVALLVHLRSRSLLRAQERLREVVAQLELTQQGLQSSQQRLQHWNERLNASVQEQTAALEERNRYLSIINAVSFALAEPVDDLASLERAARLVARLLGARAAQAYQRHADVREATHLFVTVAAEDIHAPRLPEAVLRHVAATGQPLDGADLAAAGEIELPDLGAPYAVVPIVAKGQVLGAFALLGTGDRRWGDQERHLLLLIGREIGVAVENARLYRDALNRARREGVAFEASRLFNAPGRRDRAARQALQHVGTELGARELALITLPEGPRRPQLLAVATTDPGGDEWLTTLVQALPGLVADRSTPLVLGSGGEAPLSGRLEAAGIGTLVVAPVVAAPRTTSILPRREPAATEPGPAAAPRVLIAVIVVAIPAGVRWAPSSLELVRRMTYMVSRRLQSDELVALQERRIRELAALAEIARTMQSGADIDRLYLGFTHALRTLVHYRRLYIARLDEFGQLSKVPVFGVDGREQAAGAFAAEDRAHRWFALRGASGWRRADGAAPSFVAPEDRTCVVVPIRPKGQVLGVVVLALDEVVVGDQLRIVEQAVEQLALALDSATLYQQATARASHIQALSNLARIVASVVDLREAFAAFAEELRWLLPFGRAVLLLVDDDAREVQPYATYPDDVESAGTAPLTGSVAAVPIAAGSAIAMRRSDPDYRDLDWSVFGADVQEVAAVPVRQGTRTAAIFALVHTADAAPASFDTDALEEVAGLLGVTIERMQLYERAEHGANHDLLTGLPNYRYLQARLANLRAGLSEPGGSAVFMIDMDGLKLFNDGLGHESGDQVLRIVARELRRSCRPDDFVARTGGDEFVVVMEDIDAEGALRVAERVHEALRDAHIEIPGAPARIGVSIGIATAPQDGDTAAALMHAADLAMYQAKFAGGHRTQIARERAVARSTRSSPQRDTRIVETLVHAAMDGATPGERSAIGLAQRWVVGALAQLGRAQAPEAAPWVRMIVVHEAMQAIATRQPGRDQEIARFFLEDVHEHWERRKDATARAAVCLAPAAVRLAWARIPEPEGGGLDLEEAVRWLRADAGEDDDRALFEALFAFVLADRVDRRRVRPAA